MADEEALQNEQDESQVEGAAGDAGEEKADQDKLKERIEVSVEDLGALRKKLTITVPREVIDERKEKQYGDLSRDAVVPGFRKGRAPRRLLEKRFGLEVSETITSELLGSGYLAAIEKVDLKVLGDPLVYCTPKKPDKEGEPPVERLMPVREAFANIVLPDEGPLQFSCEVEVQPQFDLPDLDNIPIERPKVVVDDADVDQQIERLRRMRGEYERVADGVAQVDDLLTVGLKMTVEGKVVREWDAAQVAVRAQTIEGVALPTLGEILVGAKAGDVRTAGGPVPDDAERSELRGKTAEFVFTVKEISRLKLPELTDEMATSLGFENVTELRDFVRRDMESRVADVIRRGMRQQVYKYLLEKTNLELPERLSQRQANRVVVRRMVELYRQGVPEAEVAKHMDELKTTAKDEAARELKLGFIMEKIAEQLKPEVTEDEVNGQIAMIAQQQNRRFDRVRDELIRNDGIESLFLQVRDEKIVDALLEKAKITETEPAKAGKGKSKDKAAGDAAADAT